MNTEWRQQHYNNSCASACLAMLLSQRGIRKQDTDVIKESRMQHLIQLDEESRSFAAGVLVQEPRHFDIMLSRYGLRFCQFDTMEWSEYIARANEMLDNAQPFMTSVNPGCLPGSASCAPQSNSHAVVTHARNGNTYGFFDPDAGLDRGVEHDYDCVQTAVCFRLDAEQLHQAISSRNAGQPFVIGYLQSAHAASEDTSPIWRESLHAASRYETIARSRLHSLSLEHGAPGPDEFYGFICSIVKPLTNDLYTAIRVSGQGNTGQNNLADALLRFKQNVICVQRNLKAGSPIDWEAAKADMLKEIANIQQELLLHLHQWDST